MRCRLGPFRAAQPRLQANEADDGQELLNRIESCVLGDPHPGLVALPELVVLLDLDVERSAASEVFVARPAIEVEPQVTGL